MTVTVLFNRLKNRVAHWYKTLLLDQIIMKDIYTCLVCFPLRKKNNNFFLPMEHTNTRIKFTLVN